MQYRVRPGYRHGAQKQYGPGDVVELTEQEAAGFLDKLEPLAETAAPVVPADDEADAEPEPAAPTPRKRATRAAK